MDYKCVTSIDEIQDYVGGATIIAFDFETAPKESYRHEDRAALDAHKSVIVGISFSVCEGTAAYVPLEHRIGNASNKKELWDYLITAVFENTNITKVAHNLSFEAMFLYAIGIIIKPPVYDTIAATQLTLKNNTEFRGLSDCGLKKLVPELFGDELPSYEAVTAGLYFDELNPQHNETIRYACADSDYALRLYKLTADWFDRFLPKHRFIVEQIESPTAIYVSLMKFNGLLANKELMFQKQAESEQKLLQLKLDIAFIIGDVDIGANAGTSAFKKYLYKDLLQTSTVSVKLSLQ